MPAIKVLNLKKTFHDLIAVDQVSFDIQYGKITALLGSNGAGKSTALNMIAGVMDPTTGSIEISGLNYKDHYKEIKRKLGYLTADMSLYGSLSVHEMLKLLGELKGYSSSKAKKRIDELTERFGH